MTNLKPFHITNRQSGADLGTYPARDADEAFDLMHKYAGYKDADHAAEVLGTTAGRLRSQVIIARLGAV